MSGEQPANANLVDQVRVRRTGNHDKRPRNLLPTGNNQIWNANKPTPCMTAPGPPSLSCTPSTNAKDGSGQPRIDGPSSDNSNAATIFYAANVQNANISPNRVCSMLFDWQMSEGSEKKIDNQQESQLTNKISEAKNSRMLDLQNPPPELSFSPADTLSKPSSSENLTSCAFSPIESVKNQPSVTHFHNLQRRHTKKHRKFRQISPLNSPKWPCDRSSSQPHSPSSLSVNYVPSPARDRSYSAGCATSNFVFPAPELSTDNRATENLDKTVTSLTNIIYQSNNSFIDKQNSVGSASPASSINEYTVEIEALEKAIKSNDWRVVNKLLDAHCSNLNRVYSSSSMDLNLSSNQPSTNTANRQTTNARASLFEKLSDHHQLNTQFPPNQSYTQYRAYSAFDSSACTMDKSFRKESADSQLPNNMNRHYGSIESPLFNNLLHLAIENSSIDVICLLLRNGFSANGNNQTPSRSLDVWRRLSDSSHDSHHSAVAGQANEIVENGSDPVISNSTGSRLLCSSREQLVPLLSSPNLLSPSAVPIGSNSNLSALYNNKMRFSITSEQSTEQNSELSSISRPSTSPAKLLKMNPALPYYLSIVRIGTQEAKPLSESNLKSLITERKLHNKEFNCCKCCNCQQENLILNLPKQPSKNRKVSVDASKPTAPINRRKSSATVSLANVSGIIQHAVQKNVNALEKNLNYHQAAHFNAITTNSDTVGSLSTSNANNSNVFNCISSATKNDTNEQLNSRLSAKNDLGRDLSRLKVCCVSNAFNKRNCCGTRYAANRYHCHCPLKEILIKHNLMRKLNKQISNGQLKFSDDLNLVESEKLIKSNELNADGRPEQLNDDLIKNYLCLHFEKHRHIVNPIEDCLKISFISQLEQKSGFRVDSALNRLLDTTEDESDDREDDTSSSNENSMRKNYAKINSEKSTNGSGDDENNINDEMHDNEKNETDKKKKKNSHGSLSPKKRRKRKKKEQIYKDQAPVLIIDAQRKSAKRRRKRKKMEETKRCSSVSGEQDSDGQQMIFDYDNFGTSGSISGRIQLETSDDSELSDSSFTFDSEQEIMNNENETSIDELSDESAEGSASKRSKKDKDLLELKKKDRRVFKKQLTETSIITPLENQLSEEKGRVLRSSQSKKFIKDSKNEDEIEYDTNNYATYEDFYNREVLYVLPPLFLAVVNGNVSVVKELIKFGANVNAKDVNGCTPLHLLLCQNDINQSLLNLLLANGAKLSIGSTNLAGVSPIDLALEKANQLFGLQRKLIMTAFSGLINGLEALCAFNELDKKIIRNQSSATGLGQHFVNNVNTTATTSTNSTIMTDTISHSHGRDQSSGKQQQQSREADNFRTLGSSQTGLTSGIFQSSQSSSNQAGDSSMNNQVMSSQTQDHSSSILISFQPQCTSFDEEGLISIIQPLNSTTGDDQYSYQQFSVTRDGFSGVSSSGGQIDKSTDQTQQHAKAQSNQLTKQLSQSASNLHPNSELIKKVNQKSQDEASGFNVAALKAASGFLRKLKSSAKSSKQKKQQLSQAQKIRLQEQQESLQQQADVYLCLEEISSDASHGSNRFAFCSSYYETGSINNNEEDFGDAENQHQIKKSSATAGKEDELGDLQSALNAKTNSTFVMPNVTRKKSLGKTYNLIEPNAPNSGLNYIINSIKGSSTTHAQQQTISAKAPNNTSHPTKYPLINKISNPLSSACPLGTKAMNANRFANLDSNRCGNNSLVQLENLSRGAESGLLVLIRMATNIECVPFIMQVFNTNLNSVVNIIDRSSNEKLNKMIAVLFNRLLLTIIEQIETCSDSIKLASNLTYTKMCKLDKEDETDLRGAALFTKWATMNENDPFQYLNNINIGKLSANLSSATKKTEFQADSSPNLMVNNLEKLKKFATFQNSIQATSGVNLCKHMKSKISDDLTCLLKMATGCLRGGQSLQYTALLIVNKLIDVMIVYDLAGNRPVRKINSCTCLIHQHNCCKQRELRRNQRLNTRLEFSKKNCLSKKRQPPKTNFIQSNSLDHKFRSKLSQKRDSQQIEQEELEQRKAIALAAAVTDAVISLKTSSKPSSIKRTSIFSAALFGLGRGSSGSDSEEQRTPKHKFTGIITANLRRASIKTGLIKAASPSKREKIKNIDKTMPYSKKKSDSIGSNELSQANTLSQLPNSHQLPVQTRKNPFISKLSKSLLIARAVGKLSRHTLIMHHQQHSSSVESAAEQNLYLAAIAKEDQQNAVKKKRKIRRCTCKSEMKSALEILVQDGISLLLNVLNNSMTLHKRVAGSKQLCTPSHRWRQCVHHCMTLLSARAILYLSQNAEAREKLATEPSSLKILLASLDSTNDPQLLTIVLQIVASLALDIRYQKNLLSEDFTDALLQLVLPSDEWFYTNHSTKYSRYVKHHACRILVYLGLEKRLRNKVYLFDLLEETLIETKFETKFIPSQTQLKIQPQAKQSHQASTRANLQFANQQMNQTHINLSKQQSKTNQSTYQQNELRNLSHCAEENAYICSTSIPPLSIYRTIENQQLLIEKEKFELVKSCAQKFSDKQLFKHILNQLDFEPKLISSSAESITLQLLQLIENRLNKGETDEEIVNLDKSVKLGIDQTQLETIFDVIEKIVRSKLAQEQNDEKDLQTNLFEDAENKYETEVKENKLQTSADQNFQNKQNVSFETSDPINQQDHKLTEQQSSSIDQNTMNYNQPPSIQVDFISSDRSSPRRSSSQRSSLSAEEANEAAKFARKKIEEAVYSKLDLRDQLRSQYQNQIKLNNRQHFFLKTLSVCLNPIIILRLLQHRLFGCFNQLWYWQQNPKGSIFPSNSSQTAYYHLLNTRGNSERSSFASTVGMESFQGLSLGGAFGSRSRASSATANSIILPNELIESNLRDRRNVSLTIDCPLGLSLSNLNNYTGASSSQRTSISLDRSSRQESYRKASFKSGSEDDQSSLFQQQGISGLNFNHNLTTQSTSQDQDEIAEFQKLLQNIPRNECSPVAARNFLDPTAAYSVESNQILVGNDTIQQRRNTATLLNQSTNANLDKILISNRPRSSSCSMPQQKQQKLHNLQQHQQTANQIINRIKNQITNQTNLTVSSRTPSNQLPSNQKQAHSVHNAPNVQSVHNLTNQQLQTLISQQLHNQNLINQHLQNQFKPQNNTNQQQQKERQESYNRTADQSISQKNSLEEKLPILNSQASLDSLSLTPLLIHHPQKKFFDRSLSIAVPETMIFQQTQFRQLTPNQRPITSSNQSFALDASTQSNSNINYSHSSASTNQQAGDFTNAGRYSLSMRSTSGGDMYNLLANNNLSNQNRFMPVEHRAIFLLLAQWISLCYQDFMAHAYFRKELNEFLNRASKLGELYLEKVNKIKASVNLGEYEVYELGDMSEDSEVNDEYMMLQQLILNGNLLGSKDEIAKLAGIQLRIQEINAYVQQHQEPQILNQIPSKQHLSTKDSNNTYSQPNSSKTPPSSQLFNKDSFEKLLPLNQSSNNQTIINNFHLSEANISSSINQLNQVPALAVPPYSSTGTSFKLHPICEYGYKERNKIRTSGGRAFAPAKRFSKPFLNLYRNSDEDLDSEQLSSKASSAGGTDSNTNFLISGLKKQRSDEYEEEQIDDTVFEQDQIEEDEELLEDLNEDERIMENEGEDPEDSDLEFDEEKMASDEELGKTKTGGRQSKTRERLFNDDFEFECDLTDSERHIIEEKITEKKTPIWQTKKTKQISESKKRKTSQSSDENLLSPYRRQSVGHSPTNRGASLRPQLINTKRQKKLRSRLHVDTYKRRYSDVFFSNTPSISQPVSQPSSRLSNISDEITTSRPSSANKLDSRSQYASDRQIVFTPQQHRLNNNIGKQQVIRKEEFKLAPQTIPQTRITPISSISQPAHYVRNRSPSCVVVPSHYAKQRYQYREASEPIIVKQSKRRGMSLSFTPSGARQLTNQVTRKLSKQLSKLNQSTRNLLNKAATSKSKEQSISVESSRDVGGDISEYYSSIETPPSSSLILGANMLIYPMINSPVQATLAAVANNTKLEQFTFESPTGISKTKEHQTASKDGKDGHMFMNQMKRAKNVFRSFIPSQLQADAFTSNLFDLKECLPATYYSTKGIDKSIKEQKRKLFHSQIYDNSLELKKLYIQTCKRLPAYGCEIFEVKEIIRNRTTRKRISRILALGLNKVSLLDTASYILTRQQKTHELIEWRSGQGSSGDRVLLEFKSHESRNCKWNLVACSSTSINNIGRTLLKIMMISLQTSSAFLAKLLDVDEKLFIVEDQPLTPNLQNYFLKNQDHKITKPLRDANSQPALSKLPKVLYNNNEISNLNCEELEFLYTMLHFPEEVALRLAEVDYELFYNVTPVDYIQHVTSCLNQINLEETSDYNLNSKNSKINRKSQQLSQNKTYTVQDLIKRFNRISAWASHLIIIQPTHDDRKAVLSCLIRVAQTAWNMGAFNTSLQIISGLKCEKIRPFMLCIKNNENPKHLNFLFDALLFADQPTAEYCDAIQRAFNIRQSILVPFFGNFIKDLSTIFQSMSSLAVRAYNQATINQFSNNDAQTFANLHLADRRQLEFLFDYNSENHFQSKIGVGNLVNIEKMNASERVLQNISTFHVHSCRRSIDLTKFRSTISHTTDLNDCLNLNADQSNVRNSERKEDDKSDHDGQRVRAASAQCSPDKQQTEALNSDLHESTSLTNIGNITQSASLSAGNLNSEVSINTPNAGSIPLSSFPTTSSIQTFQQQQRVSTICSALRQINSGNNPQPYQANVISPVSNTTTGLDSDQLLLDDNNNRLKEHQQQQQQQSEKTGSNKCLHYAAKEQQNKQRSSNLLENDSSYEIEHKHNYKPIQPLSYSHGVSFIPLSGEKYYSNLNALQLMQHGTTCVHYEEETNRISIVYLQLEQSNAILAWSKPSWSALKKNHANNFSFVYSKNQTTTGSTNQTGSGDNKQSSNQGSSQQTGGTGNISNTTGNPTSSTSSAPASDYTLQLDIEDRAMPQVLQRFAAPNQIAINGLEEGYIDLFFVKHLSQSSVGLLDYISVCKRVGLCFSEFNESTSYILCLQFGANLTQNLRSVFIMTNRIGKMWSEGLSMVCEQLKKQKSLHDQRLNWLKFKYLQLFYEGGSCQGPTSTQAIHAFGGRKWQMDPGPDLGFMHTGSLASNTILGSGISPFMYANYLKDESSGSKTHPQSGSGQSSIDLSGKRASSFAINKLRKKKSTSSLSTIPKDGSPKSRASSGEDLPINIIQSNEFEKGKKERFKKNLFHKRSTPNLKSAINSDPIEKAGPNQSLKGGKHGSEEKTTILFSQSSIQDNGSANSSFCSIDSPPIIYTSQLTFEYQEMLRRNIDYNGLGCCDFSFSNSSAMRSYANQARGQPIQLTFIEFFELFKAFLIRSRRDVRDLFDSLSSKTMTSSKIINTPSRATLIKQTSVDQASSLMSGQERSDTQEANLVRSMSVSEEPALASAVRRSSIKSNAKVHIEASETTPLKLKPKLLSDKIASERCKTRRKRLAKQISINQPLLGLISRNCYIHQLADSNVEKRLQIFDAIATASIITNCAGLETTGRLKASIPSESGNQTASSQLMLNQQQFAIFIRNYQKEKLTDEEVISLIRRHEPNYKLREQNCISFEGFCCYLMDKDNSAFLPQLNKLKEEDMNYPLSHYFIATSHNTYLTWYQFKGESSPDMYGEVLSAGCRCVELDCYDGEDGMPMIYHGRTFTTKIPFKRVVETINKFAFVTSPFPVILSIENHCSIPQQIRMAKTFREIFKEKLVTDFLFDTDYSDTPTLPTPNQLKYRILIKNKKLRSAYDLPVGAANATQQSFKQQSLPQQTLITASVTSTNQQSNLTKMGKSFPSKGFTSERTNSLISAASTISLNEDDFEEDDDDDIVIKSIDKTEKLDISIEQHFLGQQTHSGKSTPLKTTRALSQGSYLVTSPLNVPLQVQQKLPQYYFMQQPKTPYHPKVTRKSSSQVAKELSDLVIYCQAIKFRNLFADDRLPIINNSPTNLTSEHLSNSNVASHYRHPNIHAGVYQVASLSENYAKKIYRKSPVQLVNYTHHNLLRVYPAPTRLQSSNFNPVLFWSFGFQLNALNYQTEDQFLAINQAMFEQTNFCGYVLKSDVMRSSSSHIMYGKFNPLDSKFDGIYAVDLTIKIISGQSVCLEGEHTGSPLVEVEIIGLETDCNKQRTKVVQKNSLNPIFNDTFMFRINFIDLAFIRFAVYEYGTNHLTSQRVVPVKALRPGYRHLALRNAQNQPLPLSSLFIYSNTQEEGCLIDDVTTTSASQSPSSSMGQQQLNTANSLESLFRRLVIIQIHNVRPDEQSTIMKVPQEATTIEITLQAIYKQKQYQATLQGGNLIQVQQIQDQLQRSTTFRQQTKILMDAFSNLINDFVLIEEIQRQPSQNFSNVLQTVSSQSQRSSPQICSQETKNERCQRILDSEEKPLEGYLPSACTNRKFILKRMNADDPSCRAWYNTLMKNQNKYINVTNKKYLEESQLTATNQQITGSQQVTNLSPSGKPRSSSSLSSSIKKQIYPKDEGSEESSDSELSDSGLLGDGNQLEKIGQNNEFLDVQLIDSEIYRNEMMKSESKLLTKASGSNQFNQGWVEEPIESFLVCICNVSFNQPYTILKCGVKCTSSDVINQCLQKARRQDERCENFVLVEELINESSSNTTAFNASLLDPLMSLSDVNTNFINQQSSIAGLPTSITATTTTSNLPASALLNVGQTSAQHGLFGFNSNCSLNRKDVAASCASNVSNNALNNTVYVRRILQGDENVFEVQRYWFGRGRLRLMLKIEAIRIPNILIPDNFDLKLSDDAVTLANLKSETAEGNEERKELSSEKSAREMKKNSGKDEKMQTSTKTMKTIKSIKNSMSMRKKDYESLPSTPNKYSAQKNQHLQTTPIKDSTTSTSRYSAQNQTSTNESSPQQSFFSKSTQIGGQLNRFTKHARNSLKKLNRFSTSKRDKDSRDNTDDSGKSSTCD